MHEWRQRARAALRAIPWPGCLLIIAAAVCITWPSLSGRRVMVPWDVLAAYPPWRAPAVTTTAHNGLIADAVFQNMAWQKLARDGAAAWNPSILCGQPLANGLLHGYCYPPGILWRVIEPERAAAWLFGAHLVLGGIACLLLARRIGCGPHGSALAGIVYAFGAPAFMNMAFPAMHGAIAWMPAGLLTVRGLWDSWERGPGHRIAWTVLLLVTQAMSMLSGHPEMTMYGLLMAGAYMAALLWPDLRAGRLRKCLAMAAAMGAAAALAAAILWPELPGMRDNFRSGQTHMSDIRANALPAYQIAGFIAPDFCGSPVRHTYYDPAIHGMRAPQCYASAGPVDWGDRNAVEGAVYLGLIPLALVIIGGRLRRDAVFLAVFAAAALLLAFGTWLYAPYLRWMPMVSQLRTPVRWMVPASLALALLAGRAFGTSAENPALARRCMIAGVGMLVVALAGLLAVHLTVAFPGPFVAAASFLYEGAGRVRHVLADPSEFLRFEAGVLWHTSLWMGLAGAALALYGRRPGAATRNVVVVVAALDLLRMDVPFFTHAAPLREMTVPAEIIFLRTQPGQWRIGTFGADKILPPNTAVLYGLDDIRGYESVIRHGYLEFLTSIEPQPDAEYNIAGMLRRPDSLASPWLDFLNVRYLLTRETITAPGWRQVFAGTTRVYENEECLPRYYLASSGAASFADGPPRPLANARVTVRRHDADAVDLETDSPVDAWLVSSETDYGLWRASLDGRDVTNAPVLGLFRGVYVPAGRHVVNWRLR